MLREVEKLTSGPCTDQEGEEIPLSKMQAVVKIEHDAQHPWSHRIEGRWEQDYGPGRCPTVAQARLSRPSACEGVAGFIMSAILWSCCIPSTILHSSSESVEERDRNKHRVGYVSEGCETLAIHRKKQKITEEGNYV